MNKNTWILSMILVLIASVAVFIVLTEKPPRKKPQEPTRPYPYYSEEVKFQNIPANITLAGTLTLPAQTGHFPAVILITGGGPQNRDEEVNGGHKPFLVISDYLTRKGFAVLRYDDRGIGQSTGDFRTATTLDFSTDVESALSYLKTRKEINSTKIGLIGHSEGGLIAPMVAARSEDVAFIVLLAGPGMPIVPVILMQEELISRAFGIAEANIKRSKTISAGAYELVTKSNDLKKLKADLTTYIGKNSDGLTIVLPDGMTREQAITTKIEELASSWNQYLMKYDPETALEKVTCPVLALNGAKDLQVPPKENLATIQRALKKGGNEKVTLKELPNLNHFFQECETGSPKEYAAIEQTVSPIALAELEAWLLTQK